MPRCQGEVREPAYVGALSEQRDSSSCAKKVGDKNFWSGPGRCTGLIFVGVLQEDGYHLQGKDTVTNLSRKPCNNIIRPYRQIDLMFSPDHTSSRVWKMGSVSGSPFGVEDKTPWPFNLRICRLYIPTNKKQEVWDTIQATPFFPWWLPHFFQEHFETKGDL